MGQYLTNSDIIILSGSSLAIGNSTPNASLDVSGSGIISGSLKVVQGITGSLFGTSSWAVSSSQTVTAQTASYVVTAQTASYVLQAVSASFATTASYVKNAQTASYYSGSVTSASYASSSTSASYASTASYVVTAQTASYLNTLNQNLTFNGNLTLNGTASITYLNVSYETASVIYSSGSNQFGDASNDTQTLYGSVIIPTGSLTITGSTISTGGFTGSLQGTATTASYVQTAQTASYVLQAVSASFATLAQTANTASYVVTAQTASYVTGSVHNSANPALSASYALTASYALNAGSGGTVSTASLLTTASVSSNTITFTKGDGSTFPITVATGSGGGSSFPYTGSAIISGSLVVTGSITSTLGFTGSLFGTSSWAISASQAVTASYVLTAQTASYVLQAVSASFATTASYVKNAQTASYVLQAVSASFATLAQTASYVVTAQTASYVLQAVSASYATTASLPLRGIVTASAADTTITFTKGDGTTFNVTVSQSGSVATASYALFAEVAATASYVTASNVYGPYGSNSIISASYSNNSTSASFATTASYVTGSIFTNSNSAASASYAATASYAAIAGNGGVTQLLAGPNVTLSPTNGLGQVTVSATLSGSTNFNTATGSYGSFYSTQTQTNVAGTARSMSLNITDITNGVSISGSTNPYNTYIKVANAGVYDIQFSAQVDKTDSGTDEIWIWIRKNGTDISDSATSVQLQGNGAHYVAAWNFFVNAAVGDYFQLMWYSPDANVRLHAESAFGIVPGIPSLIVTANRVDQFLSNTGSFSGSFNGVFTGSLQGTSSWTINAATASNIGPSISPDGSNRVLISNGNGTMYTTANLIYTGSTLTVIGGLSNGLNTIASGSYSHAEGDNTEANGASSHAEGLRTIANGAASHAEGSYTTAIGNYSHAEGSFTQANGDYSHAEGESTEANGYASHAEGAGTIALADYQHAQGMYNISSAVSGAFILGNGVGVLDRSNLIFAAGNTVQITGSLDVSGSITGSLQGTASYATTASFALNGGGGAAFPYTGSAIITGSLIVTGSITATTGFSGSFSGSFFGNGAGLTGVTATADTTAIEAQVWFLT
jgi:hypothetical protein